MIYLLHQALDASTARHPDHEAMRFNGEALTYSELASRSNQLAHFLREQGVRRHDRVGIFLHKSLETAIAIYGILKAGAAYVPLDPQSPVTRLESIVRDCDIHGIISQPRKADALRDLSLLDTPLEFIVGAASDDIQARVYSWDDVAAFDAQSLPDIRLMQDDLAYIMYTSGSTGKPKGIMHTHASGLSYVRMSAATYEVTSDDRLSNHSPLHFDMSTFDYLTGIYCGATTTIIPEAYTLFPANLSQLIQDERLTIWYSVPFALIQLLQRGVLDERDLSSLRWILYGGEPFAPGHLRALMRRLPDARISNVYGPAEVNQCTYYHLPPPETWTGDDAPIPIGQMCDNTEGLILGDDDTPVEVGEVGELVVRTPTMMQGYWARPDLNATAFYREERFPDYDAVFYRTGDLVQRRPDGLLDFLGRKDRQVKVRGYRVELAEVENALMAHKAVEEGAAYTVTGANGDEVGAAVILAAEQSVTTKALIAHLHDHLPAYAVPQQIRFLDSFPRTGTGKINRRALQAQANEIAQS